MGEREREGRFWVEKKSFIGSSFEGFFGLPSINRVVIIAGWHLCFIHERDV